jgi:hypothetical protein
VNKDAGELDRKKGDCQGNGGHCDPVHDAVNCSYCFHVLSVKRHGQQASRAAGE